VTQKMNPNLVNTRKVRVGLGFFFFFFSCFLSIIQAEVCIGAGSVPPDALWKWLLNRVL